MTSAPRASGLRASRSAIAQRPAAGDGAKLMVVDAGSDELADRRVVDWPSLVVPGALVVLATPASSRAGSSVQGRRRGTRRALARAKCDRGEGAGGRSGRACATPRATAVFGDGDLVAEVEGPSDVEGLFFVPHRGTRFRGGRSEPTARCPFATFGPGPRTRRRRTLPDGRASPGGHCGAHGGLHPTTTLLEGLRRKRALRTSRFTSALAHFSPLPPTISISTRCTPNGWR